MWFLDSIANNIDVAFNGSKEAREERLQQAIEKIPDPRAKDIDWSPLKPSWTWFATHDLTTDAQGNLVFSPSIFPKIFAGLFFSLGFLQELSQFFLEKNISPQQKLLHHLC